MDKVAGVPKPAAGVLARMHVPLGMLLRKDVAWAVNCLASKRVVLSGMEEEQLELAITPDAVGLTRTDSNVPRSAQTAIEQAPPAPKPFYYQACATAMVPVAPVGMVLATPMPTTKRMLAEALCAFGHVSGRVSTVKDRYSLAKLTEMVWEAQREACGFEHKRRRSLTLTALTTATTPTTASGRWPTPCRSCRGTRAQTATAETG